MELGVAYSIGIEILKSQYDANKWLEENADTEIIDVRFAATEKFPVVMVIYRKNS